MCILLPVDCQFFGEVLTVRRFFLLRSRLRTRTPQIRELLNLPEMTPEEEARAREEHRWIFENNN